MSLESRITGFQTDAQIRKCYRINSEIICYTFKWQKTALKYQAFQLFFKRPDYI